MSDSDKIQRLANLLATAYGSLGHKKADRYHEMADHCRAELESEGIVIPPLEELLAIGKFN